MDFFEVVSHGLMVQRRQKVAVIDNQEKWEQTVIDKLRREENETVTGR